MSEYKILTDMHCHTVRSRNSYATLAEIVCEAKKMGLLGVAITDYGPKEDYPKFTEGFRHVREYLPEEINGIHVYSGIEANVLNIKNGEIDFKAQDAEFADWVIASYHTISEFDKNILNKQTLTALYENMIENPVIMLIGHMERPEYGFEIEQVLKSCKDNAKVIEVNNQSIAGSERNYTKMKNILAQCMEMNVPICVSSNAHVSYAVGKFEAANKLLSELEFPKRLIINADMDLLNDYIAKFRVLRSKKLAKIGAKP